MMMEEPCLKNDVTMLEEFVDQIVSTKARKPLNVTSFQNVYQPLVMKLNHVSQCLMEVEEAAFQIASGNFSSHLDKENPYAGTLKDLQSTFQHLTWQIRRVADGDYEQQVDFLGEVSEAFNMMIIQLKEREALLLDNVNLTNALASQQFRLLESEIERQAERYQQFSKSVEEIRTYRHDMKNHLLCMDALLQEYKVEEAKQYIEQLNIVFKTKGEPLNAKNYILNALIQEKIKQAKKLKIKVNINVTIRRKMKIQNMEWCILYGNALDNAIEALSKVPQDQRYLKITIKNNGNMLFTEIRNQMVGSIHVKEDQLLETSKKEKHLHGIGLKNIQDCVKKYDGEMQITTKDHTFILTFILCGV